MRLELVASVVVTLGFAAGAPQVAHACGPSPSPYWTLAGSLPEDGAMGVPLDVGIVLTATAWVNPPAGPGFSGYVDSVRMFDATTGVEVPIHNNVMWMSDRPTEAWRPDAPLELETTYRVVAMLIDQGPAPLGVMGPTELAFSFTTGAGVAPAVEAAGELAMELEVYDQDVLANCGPCGDGCETVGTVRAVRARVTIPPLSGGFDPDGYRGWVVINADVPATFPGPGEPSWGDGVVGFKYLSIVPGVPTTVDLPLSNIDGTYRPCVSLGAWDPAGHMAPTLPVCLDAMKPSDLLASDVPTGGGASCSIAPRASMHAATWIASAAVLLTLLGAQRRRR